MKKTLLPTLLAIVAAVLLTASFAQASYIVSTTAGKFTFVSSGEPDSNFAAKTGKEIGAPTESQPRIEEAIMGFDITSIISDLDSYYGTDSWTITSVTLTLYEWRQEYTWDGVQPGNSRFNVISKGLFDLYWLSNDTWNASTTTYNNISDYLPESSSSNLMEHLGTYYYFADGTQELTWVFDASSGLLDDILSGADVTIFGAPSENSTVGYRFTDATLNITADAAAVPIPPSILLLGSGLVGFITFGRRKRRDIPFA